MPDATSVFRAIADFSQLRREIATTRTLVQNFRKELSSVGSADSTSVGAFAKQTEAADKSVTATQRLAKAHADYAARIPSSVTSTKELTGASFKAAESTDRFSNSLSDLQAKARAGIGPLLNLKTMIAGTFASFVGAKIIGEASRVQEMNVVLETLGKNVGLTRAQLEEETKAIMKMGITTSAAQQTLAQFIQGQLDTTKAAKLARVAQDAAVISQSNSSATLEQLVIGIQTYNTEIIRNAGLNVNVAGSFDKYAQTLNKSARDLTEFEKQQAVLNAVIESGSQITGAYEAALNTPGKALRSLVRYTEELAVTIGTFFLPAFKAVVDIMYAATNAAQEFFDQGGQGAQIAEALGSAVTQFFQAVQAMIPPALELIKQLGPVFEGILVGFAATAGGVLVVMRGLSGAVQIFGSVLAYVNEQVPGLLPFLGFMTALLVSARAIATLKVWGNLIDGAKILLNLLPGVTIQTAAQAAAQKASVLADLEATAAQAALNKAIQQYGADSLEAAIATRVLTNATEQAAAAKAELTASTAAGNVAAQASGGVFAGLAGLIESLVSPLGLVLLAVAALGGGLFLLKRHLDDVQKSYDSSAESSDKLIKSLQLQTKETNLLSEAQKKAADDSKFAKDNDNTINQLVKMRTEAERLRKLQDIGFSLRVRGVSASDTLTTIAKLVDTVNAELRAAGKPEIVLPVGFGDNAFANLKPQLDTITGGANALAASLVKKQGDGSTFETSLSSKQQADIKSVADTAGKTFAADPAAALAQISAYEAAIRSSTLSVQAQDDIINKLNDDFAKTFGKGFGFGIHNINSLVDVVNQLAGSHTNLHGRQKEFIETLEKTAKGGPITAQMIAEVSQQFPEFTINVDGTTKALDANSKAVEKNQDAVDARTKSMQTSLGAYLDIGAAVKKATTAEGELAKSVEETRKQTLLTLAAEKERLTVERSGAELDVTAAERNLAMVRDQRQGPVAEAEAEQKLAEARQKVKDVDQKLAEGEQKRKATLDGAKASLKDFNNEMYRQIAAQSDYEAALGKVAERLGKADPTLLTKDAQGNRPIDAILNQLKQLGPEGLPIIKQYAESSGKEFDKTTAILKESGRRGTSQYAESVEVGLAAAAEKGKEGAGALVRNIKEALDQLPDIAKVTVDGIIAALGSLNVTVTVNKSSVGTDDSSKPHEGAFTGNSNFDPNAYIAAGHYLGGIVEFYAQGGLRREDHVASIAERGTPMRVWNEPEAGGEGYVPFASDKRERAVLVWQEIGRRIGQLPPDGPAQNFAFGGFYTPQVRTFAVGGVIAASRAVQAVAAESAGGAAAVRVDELVAKLSRTARPIQQTFLEKTDPIQVGMRVAWELDH